MMKLMQQERENAKLLHQKKEAKRRRMKMLMGEDDGSDDSSTNSFNLDFEKQLRKLATKGGEVSSHLQSHDFTWVCVH
jgi:hypothetical protein